MKAMMPLGEFVDGVELAVAQQPALEFRSPQQTPAAADRSHLEPTATGGFRTSAPTPW
jgi:hypothetical protein